MKSNITRFWNKINKNAHNGCWEWTAHLNAGGYGGFRYEKKRWLAHRFMWLHVLGRSIEQGKCIDHICSNRKCVNPEHLRTLTPRENTLRGCGRAAMASLAKWCPKGHKYNKSNTIFVPAKNGNRWRVCRTCNNAYRRKRYLIKKTLHLM